MFAELRTVPQISILVHTDLEPAVYFTNPLSTYDNPKCAHCLGNYNYYNYYSACFAQSRKSHRCKQSLAACV